MNPGTGKIVYCGWWCLNANLGFWFGPTKLLYLYQRTEEYKPVAAHISVDGYPLNRQKQDDHA